MAAAGAGAEEEEEEAETRSERSASQSASRSPPPADKRRRSDTSADHTLRGRPRHAAEREERKRSTPPSRPRSKGGSPGYRRQRSLPNQYARYERSHGRRRDEGVWRGDGYGGGEGRLGGYDEEGGRDGGGGGEGIVYKGRGAMKFKEKRRW
jgi:hypothetical protein